MNSPHNTFQSSLLGCRVRDSSLSWKDVSPIEGVVVVAQPYPDGAGIEITVRQDSGKPYKMNLSHVTIVEMPPPAEASLARIADALERIAARAVEQMQ